jgi:hypothetical protein
MVPGEGFEPPTFGLQNRCTATVLTRRSAGAYYSIPGEYRRFGGDRTPRKVIDN